MRFRKIEKRGQIDGIITFVVLTLVLLFLAPILFKVTLTPIDKFTTAIGTVDNTNKSVVASEFIRGKFTGMMDWVIMAVFLFSIILLLITSFLVDVHPAFFIVYFVAAFCIVAFAPSVMTSIDYFYETSSFVTDDRGINFVENYLPMTNFVHDNFGKIITGILLLSAVIMYAKFRMGNSNSPGVAY